MQKKWKFLNFILICRNGTLFYVIYSFHELYTWNSFPWGSRKKKDVTEFWTRQNTITRQSGTRDSLGYKVPSKKTCPALAKKFLILVFYEIQFKPGGTTLKVDWDKVRSRDKPKKIAFCASPLREKFCDLPKNSYGRFCDQCTSICFLHFA